MLIELTLPYIAVKFCHFLLISIRVRISKILDKTEKALLSYCRWNNWLVSCCVVNILKVIVNARVVGLIIVDPYGATQFSYTVDVESRRAVDGDVDTASCTDNNAAQPWWSYDLGAVYQVNSVNITFPATGGDTRNYHLGLSRNEPPTGGNSGLCFVQY